MIRIVELVRSWLVADNGVADLVGERVSSMYDAEEDVPAVVVGPVAGGPDSLPSISVDAVETWNVGLYVFAGRIAGTPIPDSGAAWDVVEAIATAAAAIEGAHYVDGTQTARIVAARIVSATPDTDPDTNDARATVTLELRVVRG